MAYALLLEGITSSVPVQAEVPMSPDFARLWSVSAQAAGEVRVVNHSGCLLVRRGDRVRATLKGEFAADFVPPSGIELLLRRPGWFECWADRAALRKLAADPRTRAIHPPLRLQPLAVISEARASMDWEPYRLAGALGHGVRVAVIDIDFSGYQALPAAELPALWGYKSFIDPGLEEQIPPTGHGTAVAEIIHDVAPEAELYLLAVAAVADLALAVDWCIDNGINVVNMSLGFFATPRDGSGEVARLVNRAAAAGIIWVNSAGNEADVHWGGEIDDGDFNADDYLRFPSGTEFIGFDYRAHGSDAALIQMVWDRWPSTADLLLDLELYADSSRNHLVGASRGAPSHALAHRWIVTDSLESGRRYYLAVRRQFGIVPQGLRIDIYNADGAREMQPRVAGGSLVSPADAAGAIAVGAYDFTVEEPQGTPIRSYSSQGPTWDGRSKPEIVAGDVVSTLKFGELAFAGTSASAPHVAGAAAVLSSATASGGLFTYIWSGADLLALLAERSVDFGVPGLDNVYGRGGIVLPPASADPAQLTTAAAYPNPFNASVTIEFAAAPGSTYTLHVYDLLGRLVRRSEGLHVGPGPARVLWNGRDAHGRRVASGLYLYRVETDRGTVSGRALLLK
jgi:subtilisin family serine protease